MPKIERNDLEQREVVPGHRARMVHTERMTVAYWEIDGGATMPEHDHPHEQIVNVLSGEYELTVAGTQHVLRDGLVFVIPPNVKHSGRAVSDCTILDVFCPVREDYAKP